MTTSQIRGPASPIADAGIVMHELQHAKRKRAAAEERAWRLQQANVLLEQEVTQRRLAEELARGQSEMLIHSLEMLAVGANLDVFLGHVLKATVDQMGAVGGTLWFPEDDGGAARLHLEYIDGAIVDGTVSRHPAARRKLPAGGGPRSTFPDERAETYTLLHEVAGMPEENRAYIASLGVHALLTVPMKFGGELVGWICLRSNRPDPKEMHRKLRIAEALAGQATLAIQMARLNERIRQAALHEERNRIARDIHDTIAQALTGVVVNLEAATRALRKDGTDSALTHIDHARELAQTGLQEARTSVRALRPDTQEPVELAPLIEGLVRRTGTTGTLNARFAVTGEPRLLPPHVTVELWRIAQEAITNVMRHAHAGEVTLRLVYDPAGVALTIADDGVGFDAEARHEGFGLLGMRERARSAEAVLTIRSERGRGTVVHAFVSAPAEGRT